MGALKRGASSEPTDAPGQRRHSSFTPTDCLANARAAAHPIQATAGEILGSALQPSEAVPEAAGHSEAGGAAISNPQPGNVLLQREAAAGGAGLNHTGTEPVGGGLPDMASGVEGGMEGAEENGAAQATGQRDVGPMSDRSGGEDGMGDGPSDGDVASMSPTEGIVAQPLPPDLSR
jgi:hypothetical protein